MPSGAGDADELQAAEKRVQESRPGRPGLLDQRWERSFVPSPGVTEPKRREQVQLLGVRSYVGYLEVHEQGLRVRLGVGHFDDPIAVVIESPCVQQFVLGVRPRPSGVLALELLVRVCDLRVVVPPAVPGVTWYGVQVPPVLLDVFAVVALLASKAEGSFLQDRVPPVPEREAKAETLLDVAEARQAVLSPAVRPRPGVVVREVIPCVAVVAVVLSDSAPLPLAEVRPPEVPVAGLPQAVLQAPEIPGRSCSTLTFSIKRHVASACLYASA